jgi:urate oxidase
MAEQPSPHLTLRLSKGAVSGLTLPAEIILMSLHAYCFLLRACRGRLEVLKTTQSGWSKFHDDRFRTLPDTDERILATRVSAAWNYEPNADADYDAAHNRVRGALVDEFYGPPDRGHFSPGVQYTLFQMGRAALLAAPEIEQITLSLPNLHFLPCNIPVYGKNGIQFEDDVYIPTDEPHGTISATITRSRARL